MGPGGYQLGILAPRSVVWSQNSGQTQINWGLLVNLGSFPNGGDDDLYLRNAYYL